LIEEKPAKVVLDIISDLGGIMGLCIGASLMSFIELIDLVFDCIFIFCRCKGKRIEVIDKAVPEKFESEIILLQTRLVKVEGLLSSCINKNTWLEAELFAIRDQVVNY